MLDSTDLAILECLIQDSSMQHKEIGEKVHLTGQAVGQRIRKLQDLGVIERFTVRIDPARLGLTLTALIKVFMKTTASHTQFQSFAAAHPHIAEAYRISGEGCYSLKAHVPSCTELNGLLDELLRFGNYKVNICIGRIK
jgi:Lrp/AsnC family leucine-responsive transcriptional regulator